MRLRSRRTTVLVGSAILASAIVPTWSDAVAAPAGLSSTGRISADDPAVTWVATEFNLPIEAALRRLERQDLVPGIEAAAKKQLGANFAGIWSDIERDRIYVATAGPALDMAPFSADARLSGHVEQRRVTHSLTELETMATRLTLATSGMSQFPIGGIDLAANRVVVRRRTPGSVNASGSASDVAGQKLLDFVGAHRNEITVENDDAAFKATKKSCNPGNPIFGGGYFGEAFCDPPLRGGVAVGSPKVTCSAAFIGRSTSDSKLYVIASGHCLKIDPSGVWSTRFTNNELHAIGIPHAIHDNATEDFGSISISNPPGWDPKGLVFVINQTSEPTAHTTYDEFYDVPAIGPNVAGNVVCSTLAVSAYTTCGIIGRLGVASMGMTNLAEVRGSHFCGVAGDSGSPVYKSHLARGILVGGTSDSQGCITWYHQGIAAALSTMHLTLDVAG